MIQFDPHFNPSRTNIILVGCGGTGSEIAKIIARMVHHRRAANIGGVGEIIFVDPDTIEEKNVGRQMFAPQDIGRPKAEILANRFNAVFGLNIQFHVDHFDANHHTGERYRDTVILGAVDGYVGRKTIAQAITSRTVWIDAGNHRSSGQVVIGTTDDFERVIKSYDDYNSQARNEIRALPHAGAIFPDLLQPTAEDLPDPDLGLSCADLMRMDAQHLLINQQMALISGQYLYKLLMREPIQTHMTTVNTDTLTMRSIPITPALIDLWRNRKSESA